MPEIIIIGGRKYKEIKTVRSKRRYMKKKSGFSIFQSPEEKHRKFQSKLRAIKSKQAYERAKRQYKIEHRQRKAIEKQEARETRAIRIARIKAGFSKVKSGASTITHAENKHLPNYRRLIKRD